MYAVSNEPSYVEVINQNLERLLVFETVFKEYVHTCKNIEKGNCYASESLDRLRLYFTKNVIPRFLIRSFSPRSGVNVA